MIFLKNVAKLQHLTLKIVLLCILMPILAISCSSNEKKDELLKKKRINPSADARAREFADKNPLFNTGKNQSGGNFQFASSNVLWRASLESLDGLPLSNTDYSGGVITTDWYGNQDNKQIKITVRFLSDELAISSLKIISHIKECVNSSCSTVPANEKFNQEIKNKIMNKARKISLENEKNKKK